jgi:NCS1 nucleoside transporter family
MNGKDAADGSRHTPRSTLIESHIQDYIPESERHGSAWRQAPFWFSLNATLVTAVTGAVGWAFGLNLPWTIVAIVLGSLFGTFFTAFHASQGPALGLPQLIQSRVQFGSRGAVLVKVIAAVITVGFGLYTLVVAADAMGEITTPAPHVYGVAFLAIALAVAVVGHDALHLLLRWLAVVMAALFVVLTLAVIRAGGGAHSLWAGAFVPAGFLAQFGASVGYQISVAPIVSDYTRYLPRRTPSWRVILAVGGGSIASAIWIEALGAVLVAATGAQDVVGALSDAGNRLFDGFGTASLALSVPASILIAAVSIYSGFITGVSAVDSFRAVRPSVLLRVLGLSALGAALAGVVLLIPRAYLDDFVSFLIGLTYFVIPWTAVNLVDFYLVRKGRYAVAEIVSPSGGMYGRWSWRGLAAYAIGLAVMVPFFDASWYVGPVASALGFDIAALVGLPVTCVVYYVLARSIRVEAEAAVVARDPERLAAMRAEAARVAG